DGDGDDGRLRTDTGVILAVEIMPPGRNPVAEIDRHLSIETDQPEPPDGRDAGDGGGSARPSQAADGLAITPLEQSAYIALPAPWRSRQYALVQPAEGMGGVQRFRLVLAARRGDGPIEGAVWLGSFLIPELLARDLQPAIATLLTSVRPAR
ncbi:MAG: hypothetical protein AAGC55_18160, partial [Myxococcota bacterium]